MDLNSKPQSEIEKIEKIFCNGVNAAKRVFSDSEPLDLLTWGVSYVLSSQGRTCTPVSTALLWQNEIELALKQGKETFEGFALIAFECLKSTNEAKISDSFHCAINALKINQLSKIPMYKDKANELSMAYLTRALPNGRTVKYEELNTNNKVANMS